MERTFAPVTLQLQTLISTLRISDSDSDDEELQMALALSLQYNCDSQDKPEEPVADQKAIPASNSDNNVRALELQGHSCAH
jgi:hypothetical protein